MKIVKSRKHEIKFYDSIKEMPISRYNLMQAYLMQDSGIGSTMVDVEQHFRNLDIFLSSGKIQQAITERQNLHINFYALINKIDNRSKSLACMAHSIDSTLIGDTDDEICKVVDLIKDLSVGTFEEISEELKKNCIGN